MWLLIVDSADVAGVIIYLELLGVLAKRIGAAGALAMMETICGHSVVPYWLGLASEAIPVHRGCKQGAPESPRVWDIWLNEVMSPAIQKWEQEKRGYYLPTLVAAGVRAPRTWVDAAQSCNHLGYGDDFILVATRRKGCPEDVQRLGGGLPFQGTQD